MPHAHRFHAPLLWTATSSIVVGAGGVCLAQDEGDAGPADGAARAQVALSDKEFDRWIFGNNSGAAFARDGFEAVLSARIKGINRACGLTEAQEKRLRLAGRGDVKRYFDLVEERRRQFHSLNDDPARLARLRNELHTLRHASASEPFGEGSIFSKALKTTLDPDQLANLEAADRESRRRRHRVVIDALANMLHLDGEPRQRFSKLLQERTRPPRRNSPYDLYVVTLQAAALPESDFATILDDGQRDRLGQMFGQARQLKQVVKLDEFLP